MLNQKLVMHTCVQTLLYINATINIIWKNKEALLVHIENDQLIYTST